MEHFCHKTILLKVEDSNVLFIQNLFSDSSARSQMESGGSQKSLVGKLHNMRLELQRIGAAGTIFSLLGTTSTSMTWFWVVEALRMQLDLQRTPLLPGQT
jgi:hypothetical protein